jgi:esterase/lipase
MREETIVIPNLQGRSMVGSLAIPDDASAVPAVLVIHGFRGNREEHHIQAVSDALAWAGLVSLRVDLTDNLGDSEGNFFDLTVNQELDDAQAALAYLAERPEVDAARLGITGHSLGGLVAAVTAARSPGIRALVTLSAVFNMPEKFPRIVGEEGLQIWRETGKVEMDPPGSELYLGYQFYEALVALDVASEVAQAQAPCRIIQGDADPIVTMEDARRYQEHLGSVEKELSVIAGGDHVYGNQSHLMQVCLLTADWLRRHLSA